MTESLKTKEANLNRISTATIVIKLKCDTILKNFYDKNVILFQHHSLFYAADLISDTGYKEQ